MKRIALYLFVAIANFIAIRAQSQTLFPTNSIPTKISLLESSGNTTITTFEVSKFSQNKVITPNGEEYVISVDKGTPIMSKDAPDLPKLASSFVVPANTPMKIDVIESEYTDYPNISVAPSKGNFSRKINPDDVPFIYGKEYTTDAFFPGKLAELREPYILRDFTGQTAVIYPFQYNPVTKTLRVYNKIKIQLSPISNNKSLLAQPSQIDNEFNEIYKRKFINYITDSYVPINENGNMLIICYSQFMQAMQPFINWKIQTGMNVDIADVSSIGNDTASIKAYIRNYYNTKGLKYVLFVGDATQVIPGAAIAGVSDNWYGYLAGNDSYPEVFVGRFSAETVDQVTTQVQRTITYEKNPLNTSWLKNGVCIGSALGGNGTGDNNEMDWQHERNMRLKLLSYTYSNIKELFDGDQVGGTDDAGNPDASSLANVISNGSGIVLYTGHGSSSSFVTTGFSSSNLNNLQNTEKWPFIWSVACDNGSFVGQTCFAEYWLRASYNGLPTGAIATFMATIEQSWDPPMCAQDEMVNILTETYTDNIKRTFGGISMNGCMKMIDNYGTDGSNMTDTWEIFGDPSVMVRTDSAKAIAASFLHVLPISSTQMQITSNVEGAKVALTLHNQIIGLGYIQGGIANITFPICSNQDTIIVTLTAYNYIPYIGYCTIVACNTPFLNCVSQVINDSISNNNKQVEAGEHLFFDITVGNMCQYSAKRVGATLTTTDPYVAINTSWHYLGNITYGQDCTQNKAFELTFADSIPDNHICIFTLTLKDSLNNTWVSNFNVKINAPDIKIGSIEMLEIANNIYSGILDPNETARFHFQNINEGHCASMNAVGKLSTTSSYITLINDTCAFHSIGVNADSISSFDFHISANTPAGTMASFKYVLGAGKYRVEKLFTKTIGQTCENFEKGNYNSFLWNESGNSPWFITDTGAFEGKYCSKSGKIEDNQNSIMQVAINVAHADTISFYKKTSCEEDLNNNSKWDYLEFFIDDVSQGWWAGQKDWARVAFYVPSGTHICKWVYSKDGSNSVGEDCAWVDFIVFPPFQKIITDSIKKVFQFSVYPNPVKDKFTININLETACEYTISISNMMGKTIFTKLQSGIAGENQLDIQTPNMADGIYICHIKTPNNTGTNRIVISK